MKRVVSMLIVSLLFFSMVISSQAESDSDSIEFVPKVSNILDRTAKDWFASSEDRAMLSVFLMLDAMSEFGNDSVYVPDLTQTTFLGRNGMDLFLTGHTAGDNSVIIQYRPIAGKALAGKSPSASDAVLKIALESICDDGCYKNDMEDIVKAAQTISDIISK